MGQFKTELHTLKVLLVSWLAIYYSKLIRAFQGYILHYCSPRSCTYVRRQSWRCRSKQVGVWPDRGPYDNHTAPWTNPTPKRSLALIMGMIQPPLRWLLKRDFLVGYLSGCLRLIRIMKTLKIESLFSLVLSMNCWEINFEQDLLYLLTSNSKVLGSKYGLELR